MADCISSFSVTIFEIDYLENFRLDGNESIEHF
jgi:hypothetical protein